MSQHAESGVSVSGVEVVIRMANILFALVMSQNLTIVSEVRRDFLWLSFSKLFSLSFFQKSLNAIFEVFGEDYHDDIYVEMKGHQKLTFLYSRLRQPSMSHGKGEESERIQAALCNLEAFLKYKGK